MKAIVAVDENGAIGSDNDLLFRIPDDMCFFRMMTTGKVVLMGRKTWDSLNHHPLPNRINLVLTNQKSLSADGVNCYIGNEEFIMNLINEHYDMDDVFVIGGASIYEKYLSQITEIYVTKYYKTYLNANKYLPELDGFVEDEVISKGYHEGAKYKITRLVNTKLM